MSKSVMQLFRGLFVLALGMAISLGTILGSLTLGAMISAHWAIAPTARVLVTLGSLVTGAGSLTLLGFAWAPLAIRLAWSSRDLAGSEWATAMLSPFRQSGVEGMELREVDAPGGAPAAFVAGRTLYVTGKLLECLDADELRAVAAHEASHVALRHVRGRLIGQLQAWAITLALVFMGFLASVLWLPREAVVIFSFAAPAIAIGLPMLIMRRQMRRDELEADSHAVTALGADPEALLSALKRLELPRRHRRGWFATHPSPQERAQALRRTRSEWAA